MHRVACSVLNSKIDIEQNLTKPFSFLVSQAHDNFVTVVAFDAPGVKILTAGDDQTVTFPQPIFHEHGI